MSRSDGNEDDREDSSWKDGQDPWTSTSSFEGKNDSEMDWDSTDEVDTRYSNKAPSNQDMTIKENVHIPTDPEGKAKQQAKETEDLIKNSNIQTKMMFCGLLGGESLLSNLEGLYF